MRTRNNPNAENELLKNNMYISSKEKLNEIFEKNKGKKVNIEIGMGKGDFIFQIATKNQDQLYIGIELSKTVLYLATKKIKRYQENNNVSLNNVYFMSFDAKNICEFFNNDTVNKIYLNFSDPWPKNKHEKRRLTHPDFLKLYKSVLKSVEEINLEFKTDNIKLFEYSLCSINNFGSSFKEIYLDLHKSNVENIMTEYETKFCAKGPIYKLCAKMK